MMKCYRLLLIIILKQTAMMIVRFMQRNYANSYAQTCSELAMTLDKKFKKNCFASNLNLVCHKVSLSSNSRYYHINTS